MDKYFTANAVLSIFSKSYMELKKKGDKKDIFRPAQEFWRTTDRGRYPFHNVARICKSRDLTGTL